MYIRTYISVFLKSSMSTTINRRSYALTLAANVGIVAFTTAIGVRARWLEHI